MKRLILPALLLTIGLASCKKTTTSTTYSCTGLAPTYTGYVKSVMDANCAMSGCHSSSSKAAGYDLSTYAGVKSASGSSAFMGSMEHKSGYDAMPRGMAMLTDSTLNKIYCWIQNGTPN